MNRERLTGEQRRAIWKEMRVPTYAFVVLLLCLAAIILLATLASSSHAASLIELALMVVMVLFFVFSCVLTLGPAQLAEAKAQILTALEAERLKN